MSEERPIDDIAWLALFGHAAKALRRYRGMTQGDLAAKLEKYDATNVSRVEQGKQAPDIQTWGQIATALGVELAQLMDLAAVDVEQLDEIIDNPNSFESHRIVEAAINPPQLVEIKKVPLISWVAAGDYQNAFDPYAVSDGEDFIEVDSKISAVTYALRVRGDSMVNPHGENPTFPDGTIIVVEPERTAKSGDFVIARHNVDDEVTFKKLIGDFGSYSLHPLNFPKYQPIPITEDMSIIGVVVEKAAEKF